MTDKQDKQEQALAQRRQEITFASTIESSGNYQPRDIESLVRLSQLVCRAGLAPQSVRGDAGSVAMLIALGHTLGLSWAQSVQELQVINGKVAASAVLLHARCQQSPACEHFIVTEATDKAATVSVKRKGWEKAHELTYTLEMAHQQGLVSRGGAWKTVPRQMLVARARSEAARRWFPEVVVGVYSTEEMVDSHIPVQAPTTAREKILAAAKGAAEAMQVEAVEAEVVEGEEEVIPEEAV